MSITYNSWIESFKQPFGALELGEKLQLNVKASEHVKEVCLVIETEEKIIEEIQMNKIDKDVFSIDSYEFNKEDIYFYYFKTQEDVYGNAETRYYGKNKDDGTVTIYHNNQDINKYQLTVSKSINTPKWFKEGVLYHIFIDRFNRTGKINNPKKDSFVYANWEDTPMYVKNNKGEVVRWDFQGGNLKGIISKLNYLKTLGISIIYLSPVFEAQSNHKYDTGNYKAIDPMFGDEKIFAELIKEAQKKDISIMLDGVFSHVGDDSIYFNKYGNYDSIGAYQSKKSIYAPWFKFENYPEKYDCWWGVKSLPNVNENEKSYIDYIIKDKDSVIKKWMNYGVKGWRLDVVDELPTKFIEELRSESLKVDKESILVGEVWEDASNKVSYEERRKYLLGNQLDGVTGYVFKNIVVDFLTGKFDSKEIYNRLMSIKENYPKSSFKSNLNLLGTHDTNRILTELNEDRDLLNLAVTMQMTFEGVPYVYYGDEAGMTGGKDPDNRRTYPWKNEDKDILNFYKKIIKERNSNEALINGYSKFLYLNNPNVFGYLRYLEDNSNDDMLILINRANTEEVVEVEINKDIYNINNIFTGESFETQGSSIRVKLDYKSVKIITLIKNK